MKINNTKDKNTLSKSESKYRQKIICENHFNKDSQIEMDQYVHIYGITKSIQTPYKQIYNELHQHNFVSFLFGIHPACTTLKNLGIPTILPDGSYRSIKEILTDLASAYSRMLYKV